MREAGRELAALAIEREPEFEEEAQKARRAQALGKVEDRTRARLTEIDEALGRLDRGEYGLCVDCGESIPVARLRVIPTARRCVECAESAERSRGGPAATGGERPLGA
jgi:DnaK suppressor protein